MSRAPKYAQRKDCNQSEIVSALYAVGCSVWIQHQPCDLLVGRAGQTFLLEVKDPAKSPSKRKLTPAQVVFNRDWRGHFAVVTTVQEAFAAVGLQAACNPP